MIPTILASGSPRREELLATTGIRFTIINSGIEEVPCTGLTPDKLVQDLARQKAEAVAKTHPDCIIIGADTLVFLGAERFGKPQDTADARRMLTALSGRTHTVYTGVALLYNEQVRSFTARTDITFTQLSKTFIDTYINSGSPLDKAGSYGIQEFPPELIAGINGEFDTVMGFPRTRFRQEYDMLCQTIMGK